MKKTIKKKPYNKKENIIVANNIKELKQGIEEALPDALKQIDKYFEEEKLSKRVKRLKDGSIVIDEGDGYKIMAYRIEKPVNNKPVWQRLSKKQKEEAGNIMNIKEVSISSLFGNPFSFVVVCCDHPNYGYFADACFFWTSMHLSADWEFVPVASWTTKYDRHHINVKSQKEGLPTSVSLFLKDYPEFKELFG